MQSFPVGYPSFRQTRMALPQIGCWKWFFSIHSNWESDDQGALWVRQADGPRIWNPFSPHKVDAGGGCRGFPWDSLGIDDIPHDWMETALRRRSNHPVSQPGESWRQLISSPSHQHFYIPWWGFQPSPNFLVYGSQGLPPSHLFSLSTSRSNPASISPDTPCQSPASRARLLESVNDVWTGTLWNISLVAHSSKI